MTMGSRFFALSAFLLLCSCATGQSGGGSRELPGSPGDVTALNGKPWPIFKQEKVANGQCTAIVTYNNKGDITDVTSPDCNVGQQKLFITADKVNFYELIGSSESLTFGSGTTTCYGPPIPSPPKCVCTALPCP